jgi:glucose-1-phosphate cytidylyltransferase
MTVCLQPNQFGIVDIENDKVTSIKEKLRSDSVWINGGYFVLEPEIFDYIKDDSTVWEHEPLEKLAKKGQLSAFKYTDYYQPLDTIKDKNQLEELWNANKAYWKIW